MDQADIVRELLTHLDNDPIHILSSSVDSANNACSCMKGDTSSPTPPQPCVRKVVWPRIVEATFSPVSQEAAPSNSLQPQCYVYTQKPSTIL
jgi:hypothetical protein